MLVDPCFVITDACFTEEVDGEAHALVPHLLELREGGGGVCSGDEAFGHRGDAAGDHLGHRALEQAAGAEADAHARWQGDAWLGEVVHEMAVHLGRRTKGREGVDEPEELDLEGLVLHGPVHELVGPEGGRQHSLFGSTHRVDQLGADLENPLLACRVVPPVTGSTRCRSIVSACLVLVSSEDRHGGPAV